MSVDPASGVGHQEAHEVGCVARRPKPAGWSPGDASRPDGGVHPAGINGAGVDDVGADTAAREFNGGGYDDPVKGTLARPVGQVAGRVVTGESNDPPGDLRGRAGGQLPGERLDQQLHRASVDGKVPFPALDGGIEHRTGDAFAVRHDQAAQAAEG